MDSMADLTPAGSPVPRTRGRPRDSEKDRAIREAVWTVLAARGYDNLSFEAVAEIAGCSRATLYRRFAGKAEMIADAIYETARAMERDMTLPSEPRALLLAHVRGMATYLSGERGRALLAITGCAGREPKLAQAIAESTRDDEEMYHRLLHCLHPGASEARVMLAFDMLSGTLFSRIAVKASPLTDAELETLVDTAVGLLGS